jgi:DNA-binding CsgD family transcriptional regulator
MRIIERPRLTRILDESEARILMLVAPAGFGKTTLARQWLAKRRHGWYRGSTASGDVAALAVGLANATHPFFPSAGERMRERLRATGTPEQDVDVLAELLAEDLAEWPDDAWLAIDDYHFACESEASERFVESLTSQAPIRLLIASRMRPRWASARKLLYGELHEIGRTLLAMSHEEAGEVLANKDLSQASGLVALADGWPAVIGLAALTDGLELPEGAMTGALYEYFAEELYQQADASLQRRLCQLALIPSPTRDTARFLFGGAAEDVMQQAAQLGFFGDSTNRSLELHPLLVAFLNSKFDDFPVPIRLEIVAKLGAYLGRHESWDDAFGLLERSYSDDLLVTLLRLGLQPLLDAGRLPTLTKWLSVARQRSVEAASIDLAEAEIAFRRGDLAQSEALALQAARAAGVQQAEEFRAYYLAGVSASIQNSGERALQHHQKAHKVAHGNAELRESLWGQLLATLMLERGDSWSLLEVLSAVSDYSAESQVRLAHAKLAVEGEFGDVAAALPAMELALHLVPNLRDPVRRSGFRTAYAQTLLWLGRYRAALAASTQAAELARDDRLSFAVPYLARIEASAEIGLRRFGRAMSTIDRLEESAVSAKNPFLMGEVLILRSRLDVAQGLSDRVAMLPKKRAETFPSPGEYGEYLGIRALAFAASEETQAAIRALEAAKQASQVNEVRVLAACAGAILAIRNSEAEQPTIARTAFELACKTGHVDPVVYAFRAYPRLLQSIYADPDCQSAVADVLCYAEDWALAQRLKLQPPLPRRQTREALTPREREVLGLLGYGLSNKQMAAKLYVTEGTVKVHLRHIFEKLGVRSRTEAAMIAVARDLD